MKNTLDGIDRIIEAEEWINDLEYRMVENIATEQNIEKRMKRSEDSLREFWANILKKCCFIGIPKKEKKEKRPEKMFEEIIAENLPNMGKEIVNKVQDV